MAEESTGTVLLAGVANLAIAIAKTIGGLISGSTAMLAEAAHSMADTLNQVFLMAALKRSKKPADIQHPFGYGMERYFWSLLAAVGIFVLGAGYSIYEGIKAILHPEELTSLVVAYVVLGISFVFEGVSWLKAVRQVRGEAKRAGPGHPRAPPRHAGPDREDGGVRGHRGVDRDRTGGARCDAARGDRAGLLGRCRLGRDRPAAHRRRLRARQPEQGLPDRPVRQRGPAAGIRQEIEDAPGVDEVVEVLTMRLAPDEVLVAARVDLDDDASGGDLEMHADEVDRRVRERYPEVKHIFLDPTDAPAAAPADAHADAPADVPEATG